MNIEGLLTSTYMDDTVKFVFINVYKLSVLCMAFH